VKQNVLPATIDAYIAAFPEHVQVLLQRVRQAIREAAPQAEEAIKYRIPTYVLAGNLVHFAAFSHHVGFYPTPSAIARFGPELAGYSTAKGSIQFPLDKPIPYDLIRRIVRFRVEETQRSARKPTKRAKSARQPPEKQPKDAKLTKKGIATPRRRQSATAESRDTTSAQRLRGKNSSRSGESV